MLSYHHSVVLHRNEISYSLLAAEQGVGLDGIYSMREYTYMLRAPSSILKGGSPTFSNIFPAMTECQRHIQLLKVMRSRNLECDGKETFMDLHQKPEQKAEGNIMMPTKKGRGEFPVCDKLFVQ